MSAQRTPLFDLDLSPPAPTTHTVYPLHIAPPRKPATAKRIVRDVFRGWLQLSPGDRIGIALAVLAFVAMFVAIGMSRAACR